jgi:hypothetical protein
MEKARSIAIATLWDGVPDYACAVLHFCQHAHRMADAVKRGVGAQRADLLIMLTDDHVYEQANRRCRCKRAGKNFCPECAVDGRQDSIAGRQDARSIIATDCPQMRIQTLDQKLRDAVQAYARSPRGGCRSKWQTTVLYKWWVVSLIEYSLVVLADLDVQLLRPEQSVHAVAERWKYTWEDAVPNSGQSRVLSEGDHWTPFNGGLWTLGNPSLSLYEEGLALLNLGLWNTSHGFGHFGTPLQHFQRLPTVRNRMRHTTMYRKNTWDIAFGDCDQGFLFHMFYLHDPHTGGGPIGRDFAPVPSQLESVCRRMRPDAADTTSWECPHTARHYWGPKKPWQLEKDNRGRVAHYLAHTNFSDVEDSMCAARFAEYAKILPKVEPSAKPPSKNNGKLQRVR